MMKDALGKSRGFLMVIGLLAAFGAFSIAAYGQTTMDDKLPGTSWSGGIYKDAYTTDYIGFDFSQGKAVTMTIVSLKNKTSEEFKGTYSRLKDAVKMTFPKITIENAEVDQECLDDDDCDEPVIRGTITLPSGAKHPFKVTKMDKTKKSK